MNIQKRNALVENDLLAKLLEGPVAITKILDFMFTELLFSHNFNTNKVNFHAKFNAYTLLSFWETDH